MSTANHSTLEQALQERILVLDGGMGTMIQNQKFDEAGYRGPRFADWKQDVKGNNDLLSLSQPDIIRSIHREYLDAGADIVETNTFNSTCIAQADYGMEALCAELNEASAILAREACDAAEANDGKPRWVAGVLGPTNRTASISPDVNDPGFRNVSFDELTSAYTEAVDGLARGGSDVVLIETVFDTLNAKAAVFAVKEYFQNHDPLPVFISGTITDASGRTLSGQTAEAFYNSLRHAEPLLFGFNCALGPDLLRQYVAELASFGECYISAHPNAGLPNEFGEYDLGPEAMAEEIAEWAESGLLNLVGGCCGTTPGHIKAIAEAVSDKKPRPLPALTPTLRLAGLEPFNMTA